MVRNIFVVGSGRSGTSVFLRTLNLDPDVALTPETHFLDKWLPRHQNVGDLWAVFRESRDYAGLELPSDPADFRTPRELFASLLDAYAAKTGARIRGDKTPSHFRHIGELFAWFPDTHVYLVLREPRAVVASLVAHDTAWSNGSVVEHIRLWNAATRAALRWQSDTRVSVVRYEDFIADPVALLNQRWPELVGHEFDPDWLAADCGRAADRYASGSLRGPSEISAERLSVWRDRISTSEAALVLRGCGRLMQRFGYELNAEPASTADYLRAVLAEDLHRAIRVARDPVTFGRRTLGRMRTRRTDPSPPDGQLD